MKSGDVVRLKSGGPLMTVAYVEEDYGTCTCNWFNDKKLESSSFSIKTLEIETEG
ncbi:YodC family protein [Shewanella baltica]|uniref:YodC family protein n=1 Tax=Shewanella baltica TaxID=62322 RepID=UPI0024B9BEA3|nr:DUF2158 domain-containing protein [Shewanella baltica]